MNIIQKLTLAHLKRNKGRTVVTILGICVSVAMITAVFVCIASFMNYMADVSLYNAGNFQARVTGVTQNEVAELEAQDGVYKVGVAAELPPEKAVLRLITVFRQELHQVQYLPQMKTVSVRLLLVISTERFLKTAAKYLWSRNL